MSLFTEVFPINMANVPPLFAYTIDTTTHTQATTVGHKVAYRLGRHVGGNWIWCEDKLISDQEVDSQQLTTFLRELWQHPDESLHVAQGIKPLANWQPSPFDIAEFVANGLTAKHHWEVMKALGAHNFENGQVKIEREYTTRGRVVDGQPAVSISVSSSIIYRSTLKQYMQTIEEDVEETIHGLLVASTVGNPFKGKVVGVAGPLKEKREWLLNITSQQAIKKAIETAADNEPVISVKTASGGVYSYLSSILQPVMRMEDMEA
ncbi:MAG: hypothetical protein KDE51_07265, partial [Anaerolineales bacterium]|nr:hypothetical protein [Anaerolineales bacterium]